MAINSAEIFVAGPDRITGAIMSAPLGTPLPTSVYGSVAGFTDNGYIDDTGVTLAQNQAWITIRDWNGDIARSFLSTQDLVLSFVFLETNPNSINQFFGAANVQATVPTGSTGNQLAVAINSVEPPKQEFVINMKDGVSRKMRIVVPNGQITKRNNLVFSRKSGLMYSVDLTGYPDAFGNTGYLYSDDGLIVGSSVPNVLGVSPASQGAGKEVNITGSGFTSASAVTFAGTAAASYLVENDNLIVAVLPAGSAGLASVVVTNASGASAGFNYTRVV